MKYISISICLIILLGNQKILCQITTKQIINEVKSLKLDKKWNIQVSNNSLDFTYSDSMRLCQYPISPIKHEKKLKLKSYHLKLSFNDQWSKSKVEFIKKKNLKILNKISKRIIEYCNNIKWRVKANKDWINSRPLDFIYIVENWSKKERNEISSIIRLPNFLYKNIGIFIDTNTVCVSPQSKQKTIDNLFDLLRFYNINSEEIGWHNRKY